MGDFSNDFNNPKEENIMTKEQLKELVATNIAGQGNQVDTGSTLPAILNGIIDKMGEAAEIDDFEDFDETTAYQTGNVVRYGGKLYKFTANKDAGEWDATKVERTNVFSLLVDLIPATPLMVQSDGNTTAGTYQVPALTVEQVEQAYNAVVTGRGCIIVDHDETMHAYVNQADQLNDELSIGILFYSSLVLTYTISGDAVVITYVELQPTE